ncbi:MAG: hypothetical protein ACRECX_02035 [Methyloceanibacter sp.]|uniref:hypothetical protein n=1 Tax=Methyloceanibacter sp. TaxID=1965321 RepID=UPI003D6CE50B
MFARRLALAAALLVAAASPGIAEDKTETPEPEAPQWQEFHFSERGFVASFPGVTSKPKAASTPVSGQNPLLQHDYQVSVGDDTVYSVVVFEYPEGRAPNPPKPDYFTKVIDAYTKGSGTRVRSKQARTIDGRPGYEAQAEDGRGTLNHLIDIVANGDRIYMLVTAGPKNHAKSEDALRFRDSFRLLGGPPPPQAAADSPSE